MTAKALTWSQVHAWRLAQHRLAPRLNRQDVVEAVTRTGGIQAQVVSAAELALWARIDGLSRADIQTALWRGAPGQDLGDARHVTPACCPRASAVCRGAQQAQLAQLGGLFCLLRFDTGAARCLARRYSTGAIPSPMTRQDLADAVCQPFGYSWSSANLMQSSAGIAAKTIGLPGRPLLWAEPGPERAFVDPKVWIHLGDQFNRRRRYDIARRYLQSYGPATRDDFALWWWGGGGISPAKTYSFKSLER